MKSRVLLVAWLVLVTGCATVEEPSTPRPDWVTAHDEACVAASSPTRVAGCAHLLVGVRLDGRLVLHGQVQVSGSR